MDRQYKRIIFADVDGVLNSREYAERLYKSGKSGFIWGLCPILTERFLSLVEATGALVVLSSTWRLDNARIQILRGAKIPIFSQTPNHNGGLRSLEIQAWRRSHPEFEGDFVVLDDDSDAKIQGNYYQTDIVTGLSEAICEAIRKRWP